MKSSILMVPYWVPEKYTSNYTIEQNKNYAITVDTNYYSVPIANDEYKGWCLFIW